MWRKPRCATAGSTPSASAGWSSYPELPAETLATGTTTRKKICRTFSDCTTAPRNGIISGCYPLDPYYKEMKENNELRLVKNELKEQG